MAIKPVTQTLVATMKRAAKRITRTSQLTYSQALEQEARSAGFASWHAVNQAASAGPGAKQTPLPVDPELPERFYDTPNDERSETELEQWWQQPFACTHPDGTLDVRCLDGGAWDRPTFYGQAANMAEACALADRKLTLWRWMERQPVAAIREKTIAMVLMPQRPHREHVVLAEFPIADQAGIAAWSEEWRKNNPKPEFT